VQTSKKGERVVSEESATELGVKAGKGGIEAKTERQRVEIGFGRGKTKRKKQTTCVGATAGGGGLGVVGCVIKAPRRVKGGKKRWMVSLDGKKKRALWGWGGKRGDIKEEKRCNLVKIISRPEKADGTGGTHGDGKSKRGGRGGWRARVGKNRKEPRQSSQRAGWGCTC